MAQPAPRRVAVVVVQGVGDQSAEESIEQVGAALVGAGPYRWTPAPSPLPVVVPAEGARAGERYDAERRALRRDDAAGGVDEVDLIAMRWSDLSRFPGRSLVAFVASAFGLGVQIATVGLEATPVGRSRALRAAWWMTWLAVALAAATLIGAGVARGGIAPWVVLVATGAGALALVTLLVVSRETLSGSVNRLMEAASWWVAALVIPLTVIAALVGTALWLVVDEPLGMPGALAAVAVAGAGVVAMRALGRGIAAGGWSYGEGAGVRRLVDPRGIALGLLAATVGLVAWRSMETGSLAAGLGQTALVVGGFAIRPAWMGALALVTLTLLALGASQLARGGAGRRAAFTRAATTVLSPLLVAIVGTVLVGGIGAVAFGSADDATWGDDGQALRCLTGPSDWSWGDDCGDAGAGWGRTATTIALLEDRAAAAGAAAERERERAVGPGGGDPAAGASAAAAAAGASAQSAALERAAGTTPTAWATDLFGQIMLPLAPLVAALVAVALLAVMLVLARGDTAEGPGGRLSDALGLLTGRVATAAVVVLGVASAAVAWLIWTAGLGASGAGAATAWGWSSVVALAALAGARLLAVDPRGWRTPVGGGLEGARKAIDIPYDVATYLRIDRGGDGVRTRVVARFRALLRAIEDDHDHVVVAAHSQGTMYSLAVLAGDLHRGHPEASDGWGVRPWDVAHPSSPLTRRGVSLLTFGCPIRQTYEERLPGQYSWPACEGVEARLSLIGGAWVNAYRPRDYVGRAVFDPPSDPATLVPRRGTRRRHFPRPGCPVDRIDVCLPGAGSHTGYFGDPELARWLDHLVRRALEADEPPTPSGYVLRSPPIAR